MPTRQGAPVGAPTWIDLATSDVERAQQFYGEVFGWTFETAGPEYGGYINAFKDGHPVAGLMRNDPQWNSPDGWTTYLHTADIKATLAAAIAAGAITCVAGEPMEVKDKGWMAMADRSDGRLRRPLAADRAPRLRGVRRGRRAGVSPADHHATTPRRSTSTVRCSAGRPTRCPTPTSSATAQRHSTVTRSSELWTGRRFCEGAPSNWFFFVGSDDVDKTVALVKENGGSVVRDAEDTPYGQLAAVADPTGAGFNLSSLD